MDNFALEYFCNGDAKLKAAMDTIVSEMHDAKEYGSIISISEQDWGALYERLAEVEEEVSMHREAVLNDIRPLIQVAEALAQKYMVTATNPPYLGSSRFSAKLNEYVVVNYPDVKSDLSMVMYKHALRDMCQKNGFVSFITTTSWMFLSSFEKLRNFVLAGYDFESLVDFGTELFDGKVGHNPIVAWVNRRSHTNHVMTGIRLVDYCYSRRDEKEIEFFNKKNYHYPNQSNFSKIPGSPVAYWWSNFKIFSLPKIRDFYESAGRNKTHNNELYTRKWWEISDTSKWQLYANGGMFRRWAGKTKLDIKPCNNDLTSALCEENCITSKDTITMSNGDVRSKCIYRATRINLIKSVIELYNAGDARVKYWEKINSNKRNRLYLRYQEEELDYIIVFDEKSSKRVQLITAYPVFFVSAKRDYEKDYQNYIKQKNR